MTLSLDEARDRINRIGHTIVWYGQTHLLCRGLEQICTDFLVVPTTAAGRILCDVAGLRWETPADFALLASTVTKPVTVLCYEEDEFLRSLRGPGRYVLRPPAHILAESADKTLLPALLAEASAPVIPHVVVSAADPLLAPSLVERLGGNAWVVQMPENNLTGRGTLQAGSLNELMELLHAHRGKRLKIARFLPGQLLTVSGCVHPGGTVVSYLSRQIVGHPALTPHWAAHCGNDIVVPDGVSDRTVSEVRGIARRVGDVLRTGGFLGCFGLDFVVDFQGLPHVVDINPRFQSVSSTCLAGEMTRGCFPLVAWHILAFLEADVSPPETVDNEQVFSNFSQVVVEHQGAAATITAPLVPGGYDLDQCGVPRLHTPGMRLGVDRGPVITPMCAVGETAVTGAKLLYMQQFGPMFVDNQLPPIVLYALRNLVSQLGLST